MTHLPAATPGVPATSITPTLTHDFLAALEEARHHLYTLALASAGNAPAAEQLLLQTARETFAQYAKETLSRPVDVMVKALTAAPAAPVTPAPAPEAATPGVVTSPHQPMPADVWARIAAAVQIEAARSSNAKALNPDSVLLRPDPLLAPKKTSARRDPDDFELTSPARLIAGGFIVLLIGLIITVYILTRPTPPRADERPAPTPGSAPAAAFNRDPL